MLLLKKMSHVLISMMENGKWKFKSQKKKKKKKKRQVIMKNTAMFRNVLENLDILK